MPYYLGIKNILDYSLLVSKAVKARQFAKAGYSNFKVGAALLTESGKIYTGCNIESSSYGLTICAERVALVKALSVGQTHFKAIAIFASEDSFCPPCGACRQFLYDYAPDLDVILTSQVDLQIIQLKELLPSAFSDQYLKKHE
jgi:cytidine deaminase